MLRARAFDGPVTRDFRETSPVAWSSAKQQRRGPELPRVAKNGGWVIGAGTRSDHLDGGEIGGWWGGAERSAGVAVGVGSAMRRVGGREGTSSSHGKTSAPLHSNLQLSLAPIRHLHHHHHMHINGSDI